MSIKDDKTHIDLVEHLSEGVSIVREKSTPVESSAEPPAERPVPETPVTGAEPTPDTEK